MKVKEFLRNESVYTSEKLIKSPCISIILPTYCRGDRGLLERAVHTVINQKFTNWELIIVDDGSQDSTRDIVEKFMQEDQRIVYIRNEINSGIPALRVNQGILHARGDYIAYQFDDDQWCNNMLEDLYEGIKGFKEMTLVYGKCKAIDIKTRREIMIGSSFNQSSIKIGNIIPNNAVLHSKEIPYVYGGYDCHIAFRALSDWDLWRRWSQYVRIIHIDKVVSIMEYRYEDSIVTNCKVDDQLIRVRLQADRSQELNLQYIKEYEVDKVEITRDTSKQKRLYTQYILPWYEEHNYFRQGESE